MKIRSHEAILVIEDDKGAQAAFEELFSRDYRVEIRPSVAGALAAMRKRTFAVAILDLGLPDGSGEELLKTLKKQWPVTEVVVVSAESDKAVAKACFLQGAYDYFIKPYNIQALRRSVRRAADSYGMQRKIMALSLSLESLKPSPGKARQKAAGASDIRALMQGKLKYPALLRALERQAIQWALAETNWNQVHSARLLGVHRNTVVKMMKRQKLPTLPRPKGLGRKKVH